MVDVPLAAVMGDVAATVDWAAETVPALTTTVAVWVTPTVLIVADTVFEPATVELRVPDATPLASVVPSGCPTVLPAVGAAAITTVAPWRAEERRAGEESRSRCAPHPSEKSDVALTVDCAAD